MDGGTLVMSFKIGIALIGAYILIIAILFSLRIIDERKHMGLVKKGYYMIWMLIMCIGSMIELWILKDNLGQFLISSIFIITFCTVFSTMLCTLAIEGKEIEDYIRKVIKRLKKILNLK